MPDYNSILLNFFERRSDCDIDNDNYAHLLSSMKEVNNIEDLIVIYNKALKILIDNDNVGCETWYTISDLSFGTRVRWQELRCFLNENIERIFDSTDYDDNLALKCFVNVRVGKNCETIREKISLKCPALTSSKKEELQYSLYVINHAPVFLLSTDEETVEYKEYRNKYIRSIKDLERHGYVKSIKETSFEKDFNIIELRTRTKILLIVLILLGFVLIIYLFYLLRDVSGFTLLILIGLPGALMSYLK